MISKCYKIADKNVEINSLYEEVHEYCKEYLTEEKPDYSVTINQNDIEEEKKKIEAKLSNLSTSYIEQLAVYRKIAEKMLDYDTLLFHGSAISVDNEVYLFTAKSGVGKSTHTRLWREYLGKKAIMVNDDKPLIKISDKAIVYGTPYNGKHRLSTNISVPLKAICILTRSKDNHIEKITKEKAYTMIVQQSYRSNNPEKMMKTLGLIDKMLDKIDLYLLGCNMDIEAAKVSYEGMK